MARMLLSRLYVWIAAALSLLPLHAAMAQEKMRLPVQIDGEDLRLTTIVHRPGGQGPFPTLIFHHGSTYKGTDEKSFALIYDPKPLSDWFVARGWAVVLPSRRGRGGSDGLYDEGFSWRRFQGYTCEPYRAVPGADRALEDVDAATRAIVNLPFVDRTQLMVGGHSRGGLLAVAHAGRRHGLYRGVVNFAGGWIGEDCNYMLSKSATYVERLLFGRGTTTDLPMLWIYADKDSVASLKYTRGNFDDFIQAGGRGEYIALPRPRSGEGHFALDEPLSWAPAMERYLAERRLLPGAGLMMAAR